MDDSKGRLDQFKDMKRAHAHMAVASATTLENIYENWILFEQADPMPMVFRKQTFVIA